MRLCFLLLLLTPGIAGAAESWAERLGYPPGKPVVILYAQHMGAAYETNHAGQQLLAAGHVRSAGLMAPCPWFPEFAGWCRENPGHDVGACLTFTSPSEVYRWGPRSPRRQVSSLVDRDGFLPKTLVQFTLRADAEEVRTEVASQIKAMRAAGVQPTHLMTDQGALLTRPDLARIYFETAEKLWIPAVILDLTSPMVERLRGEGIPVADEMVEMVRRYPLPKLDNIERLPPAETYEAKREAFLQLLQELPPGITQIVLYPADESPALKKMSSRWQDRVWEAELLKDEQVLEAIEASGIVLTDWREMMERFERGPAPGE